MGVFDPTLIGRVLTKRSHLGPCTYMDGWEKAGFYFMVFVCVARRNGLLIAVHLDGVWKQGSRQTGMAAFAS